MSVRTPLSLAADWFGKFFADVRSQRFFRDRISVSMLLVAYLINGLNVVLLFASVRPLESEVPVHFSSFALFDALGPWYFPYLMALFAFVATTVNAVFAYSCFSRSRLASFFLLIASSVVGVFAFVISMAFGSIR